MQYNEEQSLFLSDFINHLLCVVYALSGTGKTTLLEGVARQNPTLKGVYIVFNRGNKEEAKRRFPRNFRVVGVHGLAYASLMRFTSIHKQNNTPIGINLNNLKKDYKESEIAALFHISNKQAKGVLTVFNKYLNSKYNEIVGDKYSHQYARQLYSMMKNGEIALTHNFYLKEFELLLKKGLIKLKYDVLMLDEAQDSNMVTLSIANNIVADNKILVGDDNQQINSFRDSVNTLSKLVNPKVFYLTETFRFPQYLAYYGNRVLEVFKGSDILIKSNVIADDSLDLRGKDAAYIQNINELSRERCCISRSNAILIQKASELIGQGKKFKTVRDPNEIFSLAEEIYFLSMGNMQEISQNKFLLDFNNIDDLQRYAGLVDDTEILSALGIVKIYRGSITTIKKKAIEYYDGYNESTMAEYKDFLTTAHTCKGLEWDFVSIEGPFPDFIGLIVKAGCVSIEEFRNNIKEIDPKIVDEFNLFYVASTRAKKSLVIYDLNEFYLNLSDEDLNLLILEYKKALDDFENGKTDSFEYDPRGILGCYEEDEMIDDGDNDYEDGELLLNDTNDYSQVRNVSESGECDGEFNESNMSDEARQEILNKKKRDFIEYAVSLEDWKQAAIKDGSIWVNGKNIGTVATVGVRIGNGVRVHPMIVRLVNGEIVIENNTKWKDSALTIVDTMDDVPENVVARKKR